MVMLFSMMRGGTEVSCAISSSARDGLERGVKAKPDQRAEQFLRLRDRVEQCAFRKFEGCRSSRALRPASFCAASIFV